MTDKEKIEKLLDYIVATDVSCLICAKYHTKDKDRKGFNRDTCTKMPDKECYRYFLLGGGEVAE